MDKEVSLDLDLIERKDFIKAMKDSEQNITPADLDVIMPIFKENKAVSADIDMEEIDSLIEE